jgi:CRISPR-associated endonuclease/helicase Cas3
MSKADVNTHLSEAEVSADSDVLSISDSYLRDSELTVSLRDALTRIAKLETGPVLRAFKFGLLVRYLFSCLIDADRTDTADFSEPALAAIRQHGQYAKWVELIGRLERRLECFTADSPVERLRRQVSGECLEASRRPKGTYLLTVPTGGGKTLASLRFALNHAALWKMDRVIYVSPYTSIIDQNAAVVREILEPAGTAPGSVVLEHHSNLTPLRQTRRSKILSENWDAPVVFTTGVQFLQSLFGSGTRDVRRVHQLANSVLIFDEIQTLPVRYVHLLNNALNFLTEQCGSSVILCTATQPLLHRVDAAKGAIRLAENAEIIRDVAGLFAGIRRYETFDRRESGGWTHAEAGQLAVSEMRRSGSCLAVVNTKRDALTIYAECRSGAPDALVYHLSTSMCPAHRLKILGEMKVRLADGAAVICVSTQLIEAGVDISFGSVVRDLAGIDSVAQAAGRCNRHGEREMGRVHVIRLQSETPRQLKDIRLAQESAHRVLDENSDNGPERRVDLGDPALIETYFRYYFFDRRLEMDYPVGPEQAEREDTLLNMLSENRMAVVSAPTPPKILFRQAFMKAGDAFEAIASQTRGVIVPYGDEGRKVIAELCAAFDPEKQFGGLLRRAQQFTVNVFPYVLEQLQNNHGVHEVQQGTGVLYLNARFYSEEFGLNVEGSEKMEFQDA